MIMAKVILAVMFFIFYLGFSFSYDVSYESVTPRELINLK